MPGDRAGDRFRIKFTRRNHVIPRLRVKFLNDMTRHEEIIEQLYNYHYKVFLSLFLIASPWCDDGGGDGDDNDDDDCDGGSDRSPPKRTSPLVADIVEILHYIPPRKVTKSEIAPLNVKHDNLAVNVRFRGAVLI